MINLMYIWASHIKELDTKMCYIFGIHYHQGPAFWAAAPKGWCPVGHRGEFPDVLRGNIAGLRGNWGGVWGLGEDLCLKIRFEVWGQALGLGGRFEAWRADLGPGMLIWGLESGFEAWRADLMPWELIGDIIKKSVHENECLFISFFFHQFFPLF